MKLTNRLPMTASLLLISGAAFGHEALDDGVHIDYLLVAGAAVAVGVYALARHKRDGQD